jgi:hypothetical protein
MPWRIHTPQNYIKVGALSHTTDIYICREVFPCVRWTGNEEHGYDSEDINSYPWTGNQPAVNIQASLFSSAPSSQTASVCNVCVLHVGGTPFEFRLVNWLSWLEFLVDLFSLSWQIPRYFLKLNHRRFLDIHYIHYYLSINHSTSYSLGYCANRVTGRGGPYVNETSRHRPAFTPRKIPGTQLLETESSPGP